jgi:hypothetical protein
LSVKANSSLRKRYDFSFSHLAVRRSTMACVPTMNWSRLRQTESSVYALEMEVGSLSIVGQDWAIRVARWYVSLSVPKILSFLYFCPCGLLCEGRCERHGVMVGCINCRLFVAVYSAHGRQNNTHDTACFCHLCFIETRGRCQLAQLHDPCPNGVGDRDTSGPSE